jgi:hypothetical protein
MVAFAVVVPLFFLFWLLLIMFVPLTSRESSVSAQVVAGTLLPLYNLFCGLFIAFADATYRSQFGPIVASLSDPLYLRGVNLGVNLAGLFCFPWIFPFVGIPLVLAQLKKQRSRASGYGASAALGSISFIMLAALILTLIISGSVRERLPGFYGYGTNVPEVAKRAVEQENATTAWSGWAAATTTSPAWWETTTWNGWDGPTPDTTSPWSQCDDAASLARCLNGLSFCTQGVAQRTADEYCPCYRDVNFCMRQIPGCSRSIYVQAVKDACIALKCDPDMCSGFPTAPAINLASGAIAVSVFAVLYFVFQTAFIAVADNMILKLIEPLPAPASNGVVRSSATLVHNCPSCSSPLQFTRTGPSTQVQCYKCGSVVEFQTA